MPANQLQLQTATPQTLNCQKFQTRASMPIGIGPMLSTVPLEGTQRVTGLLELERRASRAAPQLASTTAVQVHVSRYCLQKRGSSSLGPHPYTCSHRSEAGHGYTLFAVINVRSWKVSTQVCTNERESFTIRSHITHTALSLDHTILVRMPLEPFSSYVCRYRGPHWWELTLDELKFPPHFWQLYFGWSSPTDSYNVPCGLDHLKQRLDENVAYYVVRIIEFDASPTYTCSDVVQTHYDVNTCHTALHDVSRCVTRIVQRGLFVCGHCTHATARFCAIGTMRYSSVVRSKSCV